MSTLIFVSILLIATALLLWRTVRKPDFVSINNKPGGPEPR